MTNVVWLSGVEKKDTKICPFDDPANDCYQSGEFVVNTFSRPPCYGGAGFGPCEVIYCVRLNTDDCCYPLALRYINALIRQLRVGSCMIR